MQTIHKHIIGDSRDMSLIEDKSVHLIVTSPPYWQLKDYGTENQIGFHNSYEEYINSLNLVWSECNRVLHDGCRLCINIGDQFARSVYYGRYKVIPIRTEIIRFCETLGLDYMGAVIWQKQTTMNTTGGGAVMGSFPHPRNGILKIDYEFILIFKKGGNAPKPTAEQKAQSAMSKEEWNSYFSSHWNFAGSRQDGHIAVFPEELPARLIKMFSFVGETILDPFMGSGTTALAARNLCRNSIGYEINSEYVDYYKQKLDVDKLNLFDTTYQFLENNRDEGCIAEKLSDLPYIFSDPHKMDKKIDLKKIQFGSKIDNNSRDREEYFSVKRVISPTTLQLNNGLVVKLMGVRERSVVNEQAVQFILDKTKGRRVFMRYDSVKYKDDTLLCYLYLDNKTFINAHLLKADLAEVDDSVDFKYKTKFIKLCQKESTL